MLRIGSDEYAFSDATTAVGVPAINSWDAGLDWSSTSTVTLSLADTGPGAPASFTAAPGDAQVELSWTAPTGGVTRHEYRYRTSGDYPATWTRIANSGVGGANEDGFTVTGLTNETAYTFQLRAVNVKDSSTTLTGAAAEAGPVTPTPGICGRTQQVRDGILRELSGVSDCAAVTVANLARVAELRLDDESITGLLSGDFAGLTVLERLDLNDNELSSLPDGAFSGLTALQTLYLNDNGLSSLSASVFSGLTALKLLILHTNELESLPDGVFSGLTALQTLDLFNNELSSLPDGGSARAGVDYRAASGTLKFRAGESSKKIRVGVLDDSHDEGEETLTLRLSNASSGRVTDGEATGTIKNSDPLPRALLARFGRTAAVQVVEQVEQRLEASREPGFRGRVAGRELRRGMERDIALGLIRRLGGAAGVGRGVGGVGASGAMAGASGAAGFLPPGPSGRRRSVPALPMRGAAGSTGSAPTGGAAAGSMGTAPTGGAAAGSMGMAGPIGGASGPMGMAGPMGGAPGSMAGSMGMAPSVGGAAGSMGMAGPMGGASGPMGMAADGGDGWLNGRGFLEMGLGGGDVLTGSAFALNRETRGGVVSLWSRGARSRFSGREGALSLGGDVRTTMFGADYAKGPLVVGLSLSNTRGLGEYSGPGSGRMLSSVTGLYPWLGYRATDRITVWGVTGYGVGGMLLTPAAAPPWRAACRRRWPRRGPAASWSAGAAGTASRSRSRPTPCGPAPASTAWTSPRAGSWRRRRR